MASLNTLTAALSNSPHDFIQSTSTLHAASLLVAKQFLDPLAASVATSKNGRRRGSSRDTLFLDQIYLEGFDIEQVWEQVRLLVGEVEGSIGASTALKNATTAEAVPALVTNGKKRKAAQFDSDEEALSGKEVYSDFEDVEDGEGKLGDDPELDGEEVESSEDGDLGGEMSSEDAEGIKVHDDDLEGLEALEKDDDSEEDEEPTETFVEDVHGLNDGFFSIDHFNRQSEMFEQMDLNGDVNESDEEIDYNADPDQILITAGKGDGIDDEGDREEDDFDEDLDENGNANEIMYTDFFALPPKKWLSKTQLKKNAWKNEVPKRSAEDEEQELARVESDMARANRDLFDDAFSEGESEGDQGDPANRKSAYERRQLALSEQIRKLELENVSKKKWTLTGEARATQRHLNSLLEEDLDFERIGKPVPVITQEVTETIEDMIKRRVLAGEFDELQKRRPTDVLSGLRRGRMELDDSKPQASLAEAYEKDLLQSVDPVGHPNPKDKKLQKEYEDISLMFADVTKKLDSLSSWHYTPKPPKPSISIVSDAPAIAMEEAQPTVGGGGAAAADASMLAPQEVYNPVKDRKEAPKVSGVKEIVGKSGAPVSVAEMTSEEKQKRRKQNKEKQRKKSAAEGQTHGGKAKEGSKKDVMDTLQNGGVKVIGKGGGKTDVHGKEVKEKKGFSTSNAFKL